MSANLPSARLTFATISFDPTMDDITYEFAALESHSDNSRDIKKAWTALESMINKEFIKSYS